MAKLERTYNVPLRKSFVNSPKYKRAKKATTSLRKFLVKHMKSQDIKIGQHLNEHIWRHGIKNPPHHVKITAIKDDDGIVKAELEGFDYKDTVKAEEAESEEGGIASKLTGALGGKKEEIKKVEEAIAETKDAKEEPVKDEKKEEPVEEVKKEAKKSKAKPQKIAPKQKTKQKKSQAKANKTDIRRSK